MSTVAAAIRPADQRDAFALAAVHEAAWRGAYAGLLPHRTLNRMIGRRHSQWWMRAIRGGDALLVLDFDGETVGYAMLGRNRSPGLKVGGEIYELYLKPQYQGLGFGGRLFGAARRQLAALGLKGLAVWAIAENHQAVDFYARRGGRLVAEGAETFDGVRIAKSAFVWR